MVKDLTGKLTQTVPHPGISGELRLNKGQEKKLLRTITAYCELCCIPSGPLRREVRRLVASKWKLGALKTSDWLFDIWDAIGCDDLGLIEDDPELVRLYFSLRSY